MLVVVYLICNIFCVSVLTVTRTFEGNKSICDNFILSVCDNVYNVRVAYAAKWRILFEG